MDKDQLMAQAEQDAMKEMLRTMLDICHPRYHQNFGFRKTQKKTHFFKNFNFSVKYRGTILATYYGTKTEFNFDKNSVIKKGDHVQNNKFSILKI